MNRLSWGNVLRRCRESSLVLALGLAVSSASAGELQWHAVADSPPPVTGPAVTSPARVVPSTAPPAAPSPAGAAVTMLAPVPLPPSAPTTAAAPGGLKHASFSTWSASDARATVRAQMDDGLRMMPVGLPDGPDDPPAKKQKHPAGLPMPRALPGSDGQPLPGVLIMDGGPVSFGGGAYGDPCAGGPCGTDGCGPFGVNDCCATPNHCFWISGEALLWWMRGQRLPALVTAGSPSDAVPGALGQPGTVVLFGGGTYGTEPNGGGRFRAGWWFDEQHVLGIDGSFFFLAQQTTNFAAGSGGTPALFRPFFNSGLAFNADTGQFVTVAPAEDAEAVAFPGELAGSVRVRLTTQLAGFDANLRTNLCNGCGDGCSWTVDGYTGFRGLGLDDKLTVTENLRSLIPGVPGSIFVQDRFRTQNRFYGGQIGFDTELRAGRWFLDLGTKVALGDMHQTVKILGLTTITDSMGGIISGPGGLLAQGSNIGNHSRDRFAVLPEGTLSVGYQVTNWCRVSVGYNILYVSSVVRAGDQVNRVVNPSQIPLNGTTLTGPAQPAFAFRGTDFFAQGVNLGLEFRW